VPIGELFAYMSRLYFRGKLAYAERFGAAFVITPDRGLVPAAACVTAEIIRRFAEADISLSNPAYRGPLEDTARTLATGTAADSQVVLLGSVASQKYIEVLGEVFGARLVFPSDFVGRGDMSRGGLLLRAAAAGRELDYVPVLGATRRGPRPPRLAPLRKRASASSS
jgi:hypothetical protein